MKYTGARILIEALIEQGTDTVFGYPGGAVLNIYDELYRQKKRIRHILTTHEQHAAHAADGYARSTGRTGVCLASSGPGATNLITGIAAAFMDSIPLVAITGNVPTHLLGKDSFQEVDIAGISMPVVKHNWIVKDVRDLAEIVREAFIVARFERPGPVLIDLPKDITAHTAEWFPAVPAGKKKKTAGQIKPGASDFMPLRSLRLAKRKEKTAFTEQDIVNAVDLLKEAKRPLMYAGGGVINADASAELRSLAERMNAPVALSLMGVGAMPHNHRLCTGLIGMHGTVASNKAAQKADLLVAIGARFSDRVTSRSDMFASRAKILHFDIDPAEINKNIKTHAWVTGDLKKTLRLCLSRLPVTKESGWNGDIEKWKNQTVRAGRNAGGKNALNPRFIIEETAKFFGLECIAVTDVGQHQIWAAQFFPASGPRSFISPGGLGSMGFGLGAACGVKIANKTRPVVLFTGDGSFRMNCAEMGTLSRHKIPVLIVVFNNGSLGMIRQWQDLFYEARHFEADLCPVPDFVKLAGAFNIAGNRASDRGSFTEALAAAGNELSAGRSFLIDANIGRDEKVLPMVPSGTPIDKQIL